MDTANTHSTFRILQPALLLSFCLSGGLHIDFDGPTTFKDGYSMENQNNKKQLILFVAGILILFAVSLATILYNTFLS